MATVAEVIKFITLMAINWPRFELKQETFDLYSEMLKDIPGEALEQAAKHLIATATFFPNVAEWRNAAFDILIKRLNVPTAFEVWEEVYRKIVSIGHGPTPEFSHPLIARTVDCVGWNHLCMSEQIDYERTHFLKVYNSFLTTANEDIRMLPDVKRAIDAPIQIESGTSKSMRLLVKKLDHSKE